VARPVVFLCIIIFGNTFSIGAFPVLIPDIGRDLAIDDFALGAIAGAFGLARLVADIPAGLFITHHLRRAVVLAALALTAGVLCLGSGGPLWVLILGRGLSGIGHALGMLSGLTVIVRYANPRAQVLSLNAFEMSAMFGVLCGMIAAGFLPRTWPWNITMVVASAPALLGLLLLPALLRSIPLESDSGSGKPLFSRGHAESVESHAQSRPPFSRIAVLAFAAGCVIAVAWSSVGQFILPIRASREFDLSRNGVALLLAIPQVVDVAFLLPVGALADRVSRAKVLSVVLLMLAAGVCAVAFGSLPIVIIGCVLFGIGLAAWMLPVSLLNREGPKRSVAWRTALYRVSVDAGIFLGPVLSGLLAQNSVLWIISIVTTVLLVGLSLAIIRSAED